MVLRHPSCCSTLVCFPIIWTIISLVFIIVVMTTTSAYNIQSEVEDGYIIKKHIGVYKACYYVDTSSSNHTQKTSTTDQWRCAYYQGWVTDITCAERLGDDTYPTTFLYSKDACRNMIALRAFMIIIIIWGVTLIAMIGNVYIQASNPYEQWTWKGITFVSCIHIVLGIICLGLFLGAWSYESRQGQEGTGLSKYQVKLDYDLPLLLVSIACSLLATIFYYCLHRNNINQETPLLNQTIIQHTSRDEFIEV